MEQVRQATASIAVSLDAIGYHYRYYDELQSFILEFSLKKSKLSEVQAVINVREDCILFHAVSMLKVPQQQREKVAAYLTGCNYSLVYGNFEMNFSDGEVRFKNTLPYADCLPSMELIRNMLNIPVNMMDRYGDGLLDVIYRDEDPKVAVMEAERV